MGVFFYVLVSTLVVCVLYTLYRILELVDIIRGRKEGVVPVWQNGLQPALLLLFLGGGLYWFFAYGSEAAERYRLPVASAHGHIIDDMFWLTTTITLIVLVGTHFFLFLFAFIYRYNKNRRASHHHENIKLEILWTVIPGLVLVGLIANGLRHWVDITAPAPPEAEVIEITGYQFAWASRYGGKDKTLGRSDYRLIDVENQLGVDFADQVASDDFLPREIHIPKGRPVKFTIRALDVIHSFYAPHFRLQMYAIPGMETTFWLTPTKTTEEMRVILNDPDFNYEIACNKICGKGHFAMRHLVVVSEAEDYDKWYAEQIPWIQKHAEYAKKITLR